MRVVLILVLLSLTGAAPAAEFEITQAEAEEVNGIYMVNAVLDYHFGKDPLEALANGVALTVNVEVAIRRKRRYVWDEEIAHVVQSYELRRHELSERYIVTNMATSTSRNFDSLDDAIVALGRIAPIPVVEADRLDDEARYRVRLRANLDIEALPAPLRPLAWIKPGWRLGSGWHKWDLRP